MKLTIVIPFGTETASRVERLLDCIYWLEGKQRIGSCLLISEPNTHEEIKTRIKIAAEVAFEYVSVYQMANAGDSISTAAKAINKSFKYPWLWLEPDCVPLRAGWRQDILSVYNEQPMRFMGPHLKTPDERLILSKVAVYPYESVDDVINKEPLLSMSTKTRMIQVMQYNDNDSQIRQDAVLLWGDKTGTLIEKIIDRSSNEPNDTIKVITEPTVNVPIIQKQPVLDSAVKVDKRTKAYRDSLKVKA